MVFTFSDIKQCTFHFGSTSVSYHSLILRFEKWIRGMFKASPLLTIIFLAVMDVLLLY